MAYVVSARKYRPQKFEDVVGQQHVTTTIKNAILTDKLAHAFLFCGPRGVGKTTCARLLAKVVNMEDPKAAVQDGSYANEQIDISLNVIELDAASNNSVEDIRRLIEQVRFQPQKGAYKVFIIDEVHMLSQAAFNAFLKTLEEPPPYAIFILATTEKHKILPTILSRCQLYDFRRIQVTDIIGQLEQIAKQEGITTDKDALYFIAEKADGAMRDALSIFDRVASASNNTITYKSVVENLNILDHDYFFKAVDNILSENAAQLLVTLEDVLKYGFDGDIFMNGIAKHLRNLMYCKQDATQSLLQLSDILKQRYLNQAANISFETILTALSLANDCDINFPKAKDKRLHVEIALLKICYCQRKSFVLGNSINSIEKKTPDQTQSVTAPIAVEADIPKTQVKEKSAPPIQAPLASSLEPIVSTAKDHTQVETSKTPTTTVTQPIIEDKSIIQKQADSAIANQASKSSHLINTPALASIEDLLSQAKQEQDERSQQAIPLDLESISKVWNEHIKTIISPTAQGVLSNTQFAIVDEVIKVYVPSSIAKEEIHQDTQLFTSLREYFNKQDLLIEIEFSKQRFPNYQEVVQKRIFTPQEKYDHLKSKNPLFETLINDMELKFDQD